MTVSGKARHSEDDPVYLCTDERELGDRVGEDVWLSGVLLEILVLKIAQARYERVEIMLLARQTICTCISL